MASLIVLRAFRWNLEIVGLIYLPSHFLVHCDSRRQYIRFLKPSETTLSDRFIFIPNSRLSIELSFGQFSLHLCLFERKDHLIGGYSEWVFTLCCGLATLTRSSSSLCTGFCSLFDVFRWSWWSHGCRLTALWGCTPWVSFRHFCV
jgi:hypothetical protein